MLKKCLIFCLLFLVPGVAFAASGATTTPNNALKKQGITEEVIPFSGKLVNYGSSLFLKPEDFTILENFRYFPGGIATRQGMDKYTSNTAPSGTTPEKIIPFTQDSDDSQYILAATDNAGAGYYYTEIQTGAYSASTRYQTTGTGKISYAKVYDTLVVADGSDVWAWSGASTYPKMILHEITEGVYVNCYDNIYSDTQLSIGSGETVYFGYTRPFDDVRPDEDYGWSSTSSDTSPSFKGGYFYYWATISGTTTVDKPLVQTSPRALTGNLWSGEREMFAQDFVFQHSGTSPFEEYSYWVRNSSTETYADISEMGSGGTIFLSFPFQPWQVKIFLPEHNKNTSGTTLSGKYWDGDTWESFSGFVDGTCSDSTGTTAFEQTGILTYTQPTDWKKRTVGQSTKDGYAIALNVDSTVSNYTRIFKVTAIPYPDSIANEHWGMVGEYRNRLILADGDDKSIVRISAENLPDTFTGYDSTYVMVGGRSEWIGIVPVSSGVVFMKENGNYLMTGVNPNTFEVSELKGTVPAVARNGIVTIEKPEGTYIFYAASDGIYMLSPSGNNPKVSGDIGAYWEDGNALKIPAAMLDDTVAWYNKTYNEVVFAVAVGSGEASLTHDLRYNLTHEKWSVFERAYPLTTGIGFINENNQYVTLGGSNNKYIYTLETGSADNGTDILSIAKRKPHALNKRIGNNYLYALGLYYNLPTGSVSGTTMTLTSGLGGSAREAQYTMTLDDSGLFCDRLVSDNSISNGKYHTFQFEISGRIELWNQVNFNRRGLKLTPNYSGGIGVIILEKGGYLLLE